MPVDAQAQVIIDGAEARLDAGAGTGEWIDGSRLWRKDLGYSALTGIGCHRPDCRIHACKTKGNFMLMGGSMKDRETGKLMSVYDGVNNATCISKQWDRYRNSEWHNAWSYSPETDKYYFAKRRSCHDAQGC